MPIHEAGPRPDAAKELLGEGRTESVPPEAEAQDGGTSIDPPSDPNGESLDNSLPPPTADELLAALGHHAEDEHAPENAQPSLDALTSGGVMLAAPAGTRGGRKSKGKPNAILKVVVLSKGEALDTWGSRAVWDGPLPQTFTAKRNGKSWVWDNAHGRSVKVHTNERGQGGESVESWASAKKNADKVIVYAQAIDDVAIEKDAEANTLAPGRATHEEDAGDGATDRDAPDGRGPGAHTGQSHGQTTGGNGKTSGRDGREAHDPKEGHGDEEKRADSEVEDALEDIDDEQTDDFEEDLGIDPDDEDPENDDTTGRAGPRSDGNDPDGKLGTDTEIGGSGPGGEKARSDGHGEGSKDRDNRSGEETGSRDGKDEGSAEGMYGGEGTAEDKGVPSGNAFGWGLLGVPKWLKGAVELALIISDGDITGAAGDLVKDGVKQAAKRSVKATRKIMAKQARRAARRQVKKAVKEVAKNPKTAKAWAKASKAEKKAAQRKMYYEYQRKFFDEAQKKANKARTKAQAALKKNPADKAAKDTIAGADNIDEAAKVKPVAGRLPQNHEFAGKNFPDAEIPKKYRTSSGGKGLKFSDEGFPDFAPHAKQLPNGKTTVQIKYTGSRAADEAAANAEFGWKRTPDLYTWHHVEDGKSMMLVPTDLHDSVRHTGGVAVHKHNTGAATYGN